MFAEAQGIVGVFDAVVVTTGGARRFSWLARLGMEIVPPVPSLFPFKLEPAGLEQMSGAVVKDAELVLPGTKCRARGTVLVTQEDECVFPVSQNAMEIVEVLRRGLDLRLQVRVAAIEKREDGKW